MEEFGPSSLGFSDIGPMSYSFEDHWSESHTVLYHINGAVQGTILHNNTM